VASGLGIIDEYRDPLVGIKIPCLAFSEAWTLGTGCLRAESHFRDRKSEEYGVLDARKQKRHENHEP
jgi:hypothetical protein